MYVQKRIVALTTIYMIKLKLCDLRNYHLDFWLHYYVENTSEIIQLQQLFSYIKGLFLKSNKIKVFGRETYILHNFKETKLYTYIV